jgi:hypothetical protein
MAVSSLNPKNMYHIKPLRDNVTDPETGQPMSKQGVKVRTLYPADHAAERQGDVSIEAIPATPATPAIPEVSNPLASEKAKIGKPKPNA